MWWLPQTSGYSYPRVAAIRIDVHHAGKNLINTTRALHMPVHVHPAYTSCEWSPYVATFHDSSTELDRVTAPEKNGSRHNPQHTGWPIRRSIPSFSLEPTNEAVEKAKTSINSRLLGLPGPYHRHAIGTFNTWSWGSTHRSLTNTGGGCNLGGANLPHTHSLTFPTSCLHFFLWAPPGLQFNQALPTKPKCWV
jgi:hypothetical protein